MFSSNYKPFNENDMTSFPSQSPLNPNFFSIFPNLDSFQLHQHQTPDPIMAEGVVAATIRSTTTSKKVDRHSKINTARGPRDRRMRLSLDVARRFFDLQDLLGFDKASRTVDWLLRSSSSAIGELERAMGVNTTTESCISEENYCCCEAAISTSTSGAVKKEKGVKKREKRRASVARESRRKARERARERTSQKRRLMRENADSNTTTTTAIASQELAQLHFPIYDANLPLTAHERELAPLCPWNSFDFNDTTQNAAFFQQDDEQIAEFEFNGKPWETYSLI